MGQNVTVTHKALSAVSSDYTNVTAAVFNGDTMVYYGSINSDTSATGSTFQLPEELAAGSYTLKIYGEDWNGDKRTDIATGTPYSVNITVQEHTGGTATCFIGKVCTNCGNEYSDKDTSNHEKPNEFTYSENTSNGTHDQFYACCGAVHASGLAHNLSDWLTDAGKHWKECSDCGAILGKGEHSDNAATCLAAAYCSVCGQCIEEINKDKHATDETYYTYIDEENHGIYHSCCGALSKTETHTLDSETTCTGIAHCSVCDTSFGEIDATNHTGKLEWKHNNQTHWQKYSCCGAIEVEAEEHDLVYTVDEDKDIITAKCETCGASGTVTMAIEDAVYSGYAHTATYTGEGILDGWMPAAKPVITYSDESGKTVESCKTTGIYTATMTMGNVSVSKKFEITKKTVCVSYVQAFTKYYDATNVLDLYSVKLDGVVVYSEGTYSGEWDDVKDHVCVDTSDIVLTVSNSVPGEYATVNVSDVVFYGNDLDNYTFDTSYKNVPIDTEYGRTFTIEENMIWIFPEDQHLEGDAEISQDAYRVEGLDEKFEITGIQLCESESGEYIYVDSENVSITLDGEDVTRYFDIQADYTANLARVCEGHEFNEYGFCSTGDCQSYEEPEYITDEYNDKTYFICNAGELYWYAERVNKYDENGNGAILMNDIVVPDSISKGGKIPDWTPIDGLYAEFDGNGYTISGLYCNLERNYVGFMGYTGYYSIHDLMLSACYFAGSDYVGAIAGSSNAEIYNCGVDDTVTLICGSKYVGGITGYNASSIKNSYAVQSCVAADSATDYGASVENCYYLADTDDDNGGKTAKQFISGEVAYLLNGSTSTPADGEKLVWYQTIDEDDCPNFKGLTVYPYTSCQDTVCYSNTETEDGTHTWKKGSCTVCGIACGKDFDHIPIYTESGNTITAECDFCDGDLGTLTLSASDKTYVGVRRD